MKRVRSACIIQTLAFIQKDELGLSRERALELNKDEVVAYKAALDRAHTKYQILEESEQEDGSVIVRIKKQYHGTTPTGEYFE